MTRTADSLPGSCPPRSLHEMTGRELDSFLSALPVANLQSLLRAHRTGHGAFFWRYEGSDGVDGRPAAPARRGEP